MVGGVGKTLTLDVYLGHVSTRTSRVEIPLDLRPSSPLKKSARDQRNGEKRGRWQAVAMKIFSDLMSHDITVCPAERVNWWWKPLFFSGINLRCARERTRTSLVRVTQNQVNSRKPLRAVLLKSGRLQDYLHSFLVFDYFERLIPFRDGEAMGD